MKYLLSIGTTGAHLMCFSHLNSMLEAHLLLLGIKSLGSFSIAERYSLWLHRLVPQPLAIGSIAFFGRKLFWLSSSWWLNYWRMARICLQTLSSTKVPCSFSIGHRSLSELSGKGWVIVLQAISSQHALDLLLVDGAILAFELLE